jgi:hypothetical protein
VSTRLITSFGLPVALTTGRLMFLTMSGLLRRPILVLVYLCGLTLAVTAHRTVKHLRHRRVSRPGSTS